MSRKAWIVTVTKADHAAEIFETVSARKKIGQMEEYLCDLYEHLLDQDHPDEDIVLDDDQVKSYVTRKSGTELVLVNAPYTLHAELTEA